MEHIIYKTHATTNLGKPAIDAVTDQPDTAVISDTALEILFLINSDYLIPLFI